MNYTAFYQRYTQAIEANLNTNKKQSLLERACNLLSRFDNYLQLEAVANWCKNFNLSEKVLMAYLHGDKPKLTNAEEVREKLLEYKIKQNAISGEISIEKNGEFFTIAELGSQLKQSGYKFSKEDLFLFLDWNNKHIRVVEKINPLGDFFSELAKNYNGEDHIKELCRNIKAYDFGDKEPGYYQAKLEYYFKKWLYKAVGQVLGIAQNDAMLLWIDPIGGSGKSRLNLWLFSLPELNPYSMVIREIESYIDMKGISNNKMAIDFDELPMTKAKFRSFKSYIGSDGGQKYTKTSMSYINYERNVSFLGSTNHANRERQPGFLLDDDDALKRRFVTIEVDGQMNYMQYTKLDLYQIWGQAAFEILKAQRIQNKNILSWECDYAELRERNKRYVNIKKAADNDKQIFKTVFKPAPYKQGRLLNASDMKRELKEQGVKIEMTSEKIGRFLAKNYVKGRIGNYKGYYVI